MDVPRVVVNPRWEAGAEAEPDVRVLVRALVHPSAVIATVAAVLLAHGVGGPRAPELITQTLTDGDEQCLNLVAWIAPRIWEDQAVEIVLNRLGGPLTRVASAKSIGRSW